MVLVHQTLSWLIIVFSKYLRKKEWHASPCYGYSHPTAIQIQAKSLNITTQVTALWMLSDLVLSTLEVVPRTTHAGKLTLKSTNHIWIAWRQWRQASHFLSLKSVPLQKVGQQDQYRLTKILGLPIRSQVSPLILVFVAGSISIWWKQPARVI